MLTKKFFVDYITKYYKTENDIDKILNPLTQNWYDTPIGKMCELALKPIAKYCSSGEDTFYEFAGMFSLEGVLELNQESYSAQYEEEDILPIQITTWEDFYDILMQPTPLVQEDNI
jgi:hypothetical protein